MSEVKRYTHDWRNQEIAYDEDGEFVYFEDYEKLKEQLEKAEAALKYYITSYYVFDDEDDDTEQLHPDKPWRHISGKRAREYFKEKESK